MLTNYASEPARSIVTPLPDRRLLITLNDDIHKVEDPHGETESEVWQTDQYTMIIPDLPGIGTSVDANFEAWIQKAKSVPAPEATDKERLNDLEAAMIEIASIVGGE